MSGRPLADTIKQCLAVTQNRKAKAKKKAGTSKFKKTGEIKKSSANRKVANMLWTIGVILLVLWALGLVSGYTMGGVIHGLLVVAFIGVAVQFFQGRRRV